MTPTIGITCKTPEKITDYTDAIIEFGGESRVLVSRPGVFLKISLRLTGFSCLVVVTLTLAIMMNLGIMLTVLARLEALASRAMRWSCISAKKHSKPIYPFSESAAGFK